VFATWHGRWSTVRYKLKIIETKTAIQKPVYPLCVSSKKKQYRLDEDSDVGECCASSFCMTEENDVLLSINVMVLLTDHGKQDI
jgi:hypothetical protein